MGVTLATKVILAAILVCQSALAQTIRIRAVNGKDGKPLPNQRLLVFAGTDADEVRFQQHAYELRTNADGFATLVIPDVAVRRIQVWADFQHLCQLTPNLRSFDLAQIGLTGLNTPNNCGSIKAEAVPGLLTVFARPRTRREVRDQ